MVRRIDPEDRCVALIHGRVMGAEREDAIALNRQQLSALQNELVANNFNVSEITADKLSNLGFHCEVRGGKVIMLLLDSHISGTARQFRILSEIKKEAIFENNESVVQIRALVSAFWNANSERVEWVTWKEAERLAALRGPATV